MNLQLATMRNSDNLARWIGKAEDEDASVLLIDHAEEARKDSRRTVESSGSDEWYTVDDAIDTVGFGRFQMGMVAYTGMAWLADAMEMILLSYVGPAARCEWGLTGRQESLISSSVFLGVLLGSYSWGILSDIKGRRPGYFITAAFTLLFGLLSAWAPHYWVLLLFRMLVGFGIGGSPVIFSLCSEFLPSSSRGFWLVIIEFFWTVGTVAEALLAWAVIPHLQWRFLVLISALPFVVLLVCYPFLPESPRFLLVKGDLKGAQEVLQRMAQVNGKALPPGRLLSCAPHRPPNCNPSLPPLPELPEALQGELQQPKVALPHTHLPRASRTAGSHSAVWKKLAKLLSRGLLRSTLILWWVNFASAFTYYGQVLLTTQLATMGGDPSGGRCASASANMTAGHSPGTHPGRGLQVCYGAGALPGSSKILFNVEGGNFWEKGGIAGGSSAGERMEDKGEWWVGKEAGVAGQHWLDQRLVRRLIGRKGVVHPQGGGGEGLELNLLSRRGSGLGPQIGSGLDKSSSAGPNEEEEQAGDPGRHLARVEVGCTTDGRPKIPSSTYVDVLITSCAELPGLVAALLVVDSLGRKPALALLVLLSGLCALPLLAVLSEAATTACLFGARACIMGAFAILWAYSPELYPTKVRATGLGVANGWSRLGGFLCPFVAVDLIASCQRALAVGLFVAVPISAAVATMFFPPEAKAQSLAEEAIPEPTSCADGEAIPSQPAPGSAYHH